MTKHPSFIVDVHVMYWGYDGRTHHGTLQVHKALAPKVRSIFSELYRRRFPINSIKTYHQIKNRPRRERVKHSIGWRPGKRQSDRKVKSHHAYGVAIDINPPQNPFISKTRTIPKGAVYNTTAKGTVTRDIVNIFKKHGFDWGGNWQQPKDYMHFSYTHCDRLFDGLEPERNK